MRTSWGGLLRWALVADWAVLEPVATIVGTDKLLFSYFKAPGDPNDTGSVSCSREQELIEQG